LSFLLSLGIILVIGFQAEIRNKFLKALFHAYVSILCMVVASSVILPIFNGWEISDVLLYLQVSTIAFLVFCPSSSFAPLIIVFYWGLFLFLLGLSLWGIRKSKNRVIRICGQILTILVFGGIFTLCCYHVARALAGMVPYM